MKKALKSIFATVLVIAVAMSIVISFSRECVSVAKNTGNKPGKVSGLSVSYDTSGDNLLTTIKWKKAKKATGYELSYSFIHNPDKHKKLFRGKNLSFTTDLLGFGSDYHLWIRAYRAVKKKKKYGEYAGLDIHTDVKPTPPVNPDPIALSVVEKLGGDSVASAEGSTVKLLTDITLEKDRMIKLENGTVTIDFNGHTINGTLDNPYGYWDQGACLFFGDGLSVTLEDSVGGGGISSSGKNARAIAYQGGPSVTIKGGHYSAPGLAICGGIGSNSHATLEITDGVFSSSGGDFRADALNIQNTDLSITGGVFEKTVSIGENADASISGGDFKLGLWSEVAYPCSIRISGGNYYGWHPLYISGIVNKKVEISGGHFEVSHPSGFTDYDYGVNEMHDCRTVAAAILCCSHYKVQEDEKALGNIRITGGEFVCGSTVEASFQKTLRIGTTRYTPEEAMKTIVPVGYKAVYEKSGTDPSVDVYYGPSFSVVKE